MAKKQQDDIQFSSALSGLSLDKLEKATGVSEPPMSEDEKELILKAETMFSFAKRHREIYIDRAKRNYLLYIGKQWDYKKPTFKTVPVTNIVWSTIEYSVPLMTESKPIVKCIPRNADDAPYGEGATKALEFVWDNTNMTKKLSDIMRNVLVLGDDFIKIYWDYDKEEIVHDPVDMEYFYPQPYVNEVSKMSYCIHAEPRPLYEIATMYPLGKYVTADPTESPMADAMDSAMESGETKEALSAEGSTVSKTGTKIYLNNALVKELFLDDKTLVTKSEVIKGPDGMPMYEMDDKNGDYKLDKKGERIERKIFYKERKYPYGRIIIWAGKVLLLDTAYPFKHAHAPYIHFYNVKMRRDFWSIGDPYQLRAIQTQINKRKAQIDFMADLSGNAIWIADIESGVRPNQLTNRPGLVIWKHQAGDVRREAAPSIPEYFFRTIDDLKIEGEVVSGLSGVVRGEKPGSVSAGSAIAELIERAEVRIKEKVKYMEAALIEMGKMDMSLIRQFWEEPRQFMILGKTLFQDSTNQMSNASNMSGINGMNGMNGMNQQPRSVEFSGSSLRADPDVKVVAGSTMPTSKTSRFEQEVVMFREGIVDRQAFLEDIEYPNTDVVLSRMNEQERQSQQTQQQIQQSEDKQKLMNYLARIQTAKIGAESKLKDRQMSTAGNLQSINLQNRGALERDLQGNVFDFNKFLTGPTNRGVNNIV